MTEGSVGLLPSDPCRGLPRGWEGTLSQLLWPGHSQMERGLSRLRCTEGLMGPSRRSRSSEPREAFQPPAGPSAPAWRPVGWVAGLDAAAGGCRVRTWVLWAGLEGRGCGLSRAACPPSLLGASRLLHSAAGPAPEKCLLGVRRLSASWPLAHKACQQRGLRSGTWDPAPMLRVDGLGFSGLPGLGPLGQSGTPSCPSTCWEPGAGTGETAWHAAGPRGAAGRGSDLSLGTVLPAREPPGGLTQWDGARRGTEVQSVWASPSRLLAGVCGGRRAGPGRRRPRHGGDGEAPLPFSVCLTGPALPPSAEALPPAPLLTTGTRLVTPAESVWGVGVNLCPGGC